MLCGADMKYQYGISNIMDITASHLDPCEMYMCMYIP